MARQQECRSLLYLGCVAATILTVFSILLSAISTRWVADHLFVPAHDEHIQYHGRWLSSPNRLIKIAGFPGSSFDFAMFNSSMVILSLLNDDKHAQTSEPVDRDLGNIVVVPALMKTVPSPPIDISVTINETLVTQISSASKRVLVASDLDPEKLYRISVQLENNFVGGHIQVQGLYVERGATIMHPSQVKSSIDVVDRSFATKVQLMHNTTITGGNRKVEVMLPAHLCGGARSGKGWLDYLEQHFANTSFISIPLQEGNCITRQCRIHGKNNTSRATSSSSIQYTFFRAGPPDTDLYAHFWPFDAGDRYPMALVLMLRLNDVEAALALALPTKHKANQFVQDFARTYASFIQTVRRTAYSPSTLSSFRKIQQSPRIPTQDSNHDLDESYLYNSSPSNVPIFLVLEPLPSQILLPQSRLLRNILQHATSNVLSELKWHIGDKHTFVIDTMGWLQDKDFRALVPGGDEKRIPRFELTQSGHIRFAYYMSLHLCHSLGDSMPAEECPFNRHDDYMGTLNVPEVAGVAKVIEEKKVEKIKEMFGIKPRIH